MTDPLPGRRLLLVGGTGGLLGRALAPELGSGFRLRSLHRHPLPGEERPGIEWMPADLEDVVDWEAAVAGVDAVVNVAWYRSGSEARFARLYRGLHGLLGAARRAGVRRLVHLSVPDAPASLETGLPYLVYKRRFDRALAESGLSYRILRPTAMFGPGDVLLGVMMRLIRRYHRFPMFGSGAYHLSPIAATDVARAVRLEVDGAASGTVDLGGPRRFEYRELTDLMFRLTGRPPRYLHLSPASSRRLARLFEAVGSSLLYAYEVDWLLSDRLGLPPYAALDRPLTPVEPYLESLSGYPRRTGGA
jgi:uncharacterized protein YbjT (DUF2867 family)